MSKVIFLGTDLHGPPTELAAKTVASIKTNTKEYKIVSIEHRKRPVKQKDALIIRKIVDISRLRRAFQALALPAVLAGLRAKGYNVISSFWVANRAYHKFLFRFLKLIGYKIIFTVISGEDIRFDVLKDCDLVVCQSERMCKSAEKILEKDKVKLICPYVDLNVFKPSKKKLEILMPSIPYSIENFEERGIYVMLDAMTKLKFPAAAIFRSEEAFEYFKEKSIPNLKVINKTLSDKELAKIMASSRIIPLIYSLNAPDMPLSAIEGLACGCAIICTQGMGIADIIQKEKCGIVIKSNKELIPAIKKILKNKEYNQKARKAAEKHFSMNNSIEYRELYATH